jgi:hypothetical protein
MNCMKLGLVISVLLLIFSFSKAGATLSVPSDPAAPSAYSPTAPDWKVASAYGPRYVTTGSTVHGGIDYSQQTGNYDKGVMLKADEDRTINRIQVTGVKYIRLSNTTESIRYDYMHIFDDATLPITIANSNVTAAGYSKVVLTTVKKDNNTGTCGQIRFFKLVGGVHQIQKALTEPACSTRGFTAGGKTVKAQTSVTAGEDIAPMGTSGGFAAHLHLQLNEGLDNVLAVTAGVNRGLIAGKTDRFTVDLYEDFYDQTVLDSMTNGPGFLIKVNENSLVPVLDKIKIQVPLEGNQWKTTSFSFGGRVGQNKVNLNNIKKGFDAAAFDGSATPLVGPVAWGESGKPREMWFFAPHTEADFANVPGGDNKLKITLTTIYGETFVAEVPFRWEECYIQDPSTGLLWLKDAKAAGMMTWTDAMVNLSGKTFCGKTGWRLPKIEEWVTFASQGQVTWWGNYGYIFGQKTYLVPGLTARGFINVQSYYYWSSSTYAYNTIYAWFVDMGYGYVFYDVKDYNNYYVWPVRTGQ